MISPSPPVTVMPPARAIVERAFDKLRSYGTPPYVVYLADADGNLRRIAFRASDEMMNDVSYPIGDRLPLANIYRAFVGPLSLAVHEAVMPPNAQSSPSPRSSNAPSGLESDLKTIVTVTANAPPAYRLDVRGIETIGGHQVYHIDLAPRLDPERFALRALWIDTSTYNIRRASYVTHPDIVPIGEADLTVEFSQVGPYWIAARWIVLYHSPDLPHPGYRELEVKQMTFPTKLPDWLFDERAYEQHRRDHDVDYLHHIFPGGAP
ncbi:MAG TPA: hypothetical protein VMF11_08710 [Candidatus Baltobacteraceae bacterium]|nr:hypothetical protein [Candidatus Baltobacteraceae bacterium]